MTVLFTDPHCGVNRVANTTPKSRVMLRKEIMRKLGYILWDVAGKNDQVFCLGDLFDTYSNDEALLLSVFPIVERLDWCLAGNHDLVSIKDKTGSLELFHKRCLEGGFDKFCYTPFGMAGVGTRKVKDTLYVAVPHTTTQELFEESLSQAIDIADNSACRFKHLLLHCNYESPYADTETELNLSKEMAEELLTAFDLVLIGHEHNQREALEGRVILLGNIFPTSFSDLADKRVMIIDDETGEYRFETIWKLSDHFFDVNAAGLEDVPDTAQIVRVSGYCPLAEAQKLSQAVKAAWQRLPNLLALKVDVTMEGLDTVGDVTATLEDLPTMIEKELQGTPLAALWNELYAEVTSNDRS